MTPRPLPTADIAAAGDALMAIAHCQTPARIGAIGSCLMGLLAGCEEVPAR
jgi:hypothetical protein